MTPVGKRRFQRKSLSGRFTYVCLFLSFLPLRLGPETPRQLCFFFVYGVAYAPVGFADVCSHAICSGSPRSRVSLPTYPTFRVISIN